MKRLTKGKLSGKRTANEAATKGKTKRQSHERQRNERQTKGKTSWYTHERQRMANERQSTLQRTTNAATNDTRSGNELETTRQPTPNDTASKWQ